MNKLTPERISELQAQITAYKDSGLSLRQIARAMGYKNVNSISHILKQKPMTFEQFLINKYPLYAEIDFNLINVSWGEVFRLYNEYLEQNRVIVKVAR